MSTEARVGSWSCSASWPTSTPTGSLPVALPCLGVSPAPPHTLLMLHHLSSSTTVTEADTPRTRPWVFPGGRNPSALCFLPSPPPPIPFLCVCQPLCLCLCLAVCLSLSISVLGVSLSLPLSVSLCVSLSVCVCLPLSLSGPYVYILQGSPTPHGPRGTRPTRPPSLLLLGAPAAGSQEEPRWGRPGPAPVKGSGSRTQRRAGTPFLKGERLQTTQIPAPQRTAP